MIARLCMSALSACDIDSNYIRIYLKRQAIHFMFMRTFTNPTNYLPITYLKVCKQLSEKIFCSLAEMSVLAVKLKVLICNQIL